MAATEKTRADNGTYSITPDERLAGAREKIRRAKDHIKELSIQAQIWTDFNRNCFVAEDDPKSGERRYRIQFRSAIPPDAPLLIGDAAHNLRSALDHLAWQLVEANGVTPDRCFYPLFAKVKDDTAFDKAMKEKRNEIPISDHATRLVKATQPYQPGYVGLGLLQELNNFDKHRLLVVAVVQSHTIGMELSEDVVRAAIQRAGSSGVSFKMKIAPELRAGGVVENSDVLWIAPAESKDDVQPAFVPQLAFRVPRAIEGKAVLPFLADVVQLVERVVEQFLPVL